MAQTAHALGIPESAIYVEPDSQNTIQNSCYAARIMKVHGWRSAEVISNAGHLPRAGLIFSHLPLQWRMHSAPPLQPVPVVLAATGTTIETLKTVRYLVWTRQMERCEP
jgi:vancomycin permeability regulator SanA